MSRRRQLFELRWQATRLREQPVLWSLLIVLSANLIVFWALAADAASGRLAVGHVVTFASAAVSTSMIAFGGLSWALDGAAAPAGAVLRLQEAMRPAGSLAHGNRAAQNMPVREIRFRNVTFAYPGTTDPVLAGFDLTIPAAMSLAIVGQNGAGKTPPANRLCRSHAPNEEAIEIEGAVWRDLALDPWRDGVPGVFQDFPNFDLPLPATAPPGGAPACTSAC